MNCVCRQVHRAFATKSRNNRLGAYFLQSSATVRGHARCFSLEKHEILPEEKAFIVQTMRDLRQSEKIWKRTRDTHALNKFLNKIFLTNEFSSFYIVSFIRNACDECHFDLVFSLFLSLSKSLKANDIEFSPSLEQKIDILNSVLNLKNFQLLQLACTIFKIQEETLSFKGFVDELVQKEKLVEASYCIGALNLHQEYDIEKIVLPLLMEGKVNPAVSCMTNCPDIQLKIAQKLDTLLVTRNLDARNLSNNSKIIFKTLTSVVNIFKIPPEKCKNLLYIRGRAAINILLKKKYKQSILQTTWEEMVMSVIAENPYLKEHLIYKLVLKKDIDTALKMVSKLNMHDFDITSLTSGIENTSNSTTITDNVDEEITNEKFEIDEDPEYLTFCLAASDIKFIDTKEKFFECISDITQNYSIVGVDSEWKPHFGLSEERLSLIQLAVHDKVYIIDLISLKGCLETDHWDMLMNDVFGSAKIIKLGCGIMSDVQMLVENSNGTEGRVMRFSHILDMAVFYQKVQEVYPDHFKIKTDNPKNLMGLSKLCEIFLGKPLNKEERLCDWEKRPLTESQLEYAALDAHCLLKMYDKLKQEALEKDIKFEHLVKLSIVLTNRLWKPKGKLRGLQKEKGVDIKKRIHIEQFKVVVDSELEHLGEQLRQLGADVVILSYSDTHEDAVQISKSEERLLICSESLWNLVKHKVPHGFCCNSLQDDSSISQILQRFNVKLGTKSISRCSICNSEAGIRLSAEEVNLLHESTLQQNTTILEKDGNTSNVQKILREMVKSGIDIKFNNQNDTSLSQKTGKTYLCIKCGNVQ